MSRSPIICHHLHRNLLSCSANQRDEKYVFFLESTFFRFLPSTARGSATFEMKSSERVWHLGPTAEWTTDLFDEETTRGRVILSQIIANGDPTRMKRKRKSFRRRSFPSALDGRNQRRRANLMTTSIQCPRLRHRLNQEDWVQ